MASSLNNAQTKKYANASPPRSLGPLSSLEEYVRPDWWRKVFNATYLKTGTYGVIMIGEGLGMRMTPMS